MNLIGSEMISPPVLPHKAVEQTGEIHSQKEEYRVEGSKIADIEEKDKSLTSKSCKDITSNVSTYIPGDDATVNDSKHFERNPNSSLNNVGNSGNSIDELSTNDKMDEISSDKVTCESHLKFKSQHPVSTLSGNPGITNTMSEKGDKCEDSVKHGCEPKEQSDTVKMSLNKELSTPLPSPTGTCDDGVVNKDIDTMDSTKQGENLNSDNKISFLPDIAQSNDNGESQTKLEDRVNDDSNLENSVVKGQEDNTPLVEAIKESFPSVHSDFVCNGTQDLHSSEDTKSSACVIKSTYASKENSLLNTPPLPSSKRRRKSGGKSGSGDQKGAKSRGESSDFTPFIYEKVESSLGNGLKVKYRRKSAEVLTDRTRMAESENGADKRDALVSPDKGTVQVLRQSDRIKSNSCDNLSKFSKDERKEYSIGPKRRLSEGESGANSSILEKCKQSSTESQDKSIEIQVCSTGSGVNKAFDVTCNTVTDPVKIQCSGPSGYDELSQKDREFIKIESSKSTELSLDCSIPHTKSSPLTPLSSTSSSSAHSPSSSTITSSSLSTTAPSIILTSLTQTSSDRVVSTSTSVKTPLLSLHTSPSPSRLSPVPRLTNLNDSNIHVATESENKSTLSSASVYSSSSDEQDIENCYKIKSKVLIRKLPEEIFQRYYYLKHETFPEDCSSSSDNRDLEIPPELVFKFKKYSPRSKQYKIRSKPQQAPVCNTQEKKPKSRRSTKVKRQGKKQTKRNDIVHVGHEDEDNNIKNVDATPHQNVTTKSVQIMDSNYSSLVDPKIISMSSALLQAFNKETAAESIAFKKRPKYKPAKTSKNLKSRKPVSKLKKVLHQSRVKKRCVHMEKKMHVPNITPNKSTHESQDIHSSDRHNTMQNTETTNHNDSSKTCPGAKQINKTESSLTEKLSKSSQKTIHKHKLSRSGPKSSKQSVKKSPVVDRNIFENELFLEAGTLAETSGVNKGDTSDYRVNCCRRRHISTPDVTKDTDLMLQEYSNEIDLRNTRARTEINSTPMPDDLPKLRDDEHEIGRSIIEHAKHWDLQASKSFKTEERDKKDNSQPGRPHQSADLPKLSPINTKEEFCSNHRSSTTIPTLYVEEEKRPGVDSLPDAAKSIKSEQIEPTSSHFGNYWSTNYTSLSIDCAQPLDLSTGTSQLPRDNDYPLVPSNVPLSMNIPEIKVTSPGSSITTFGQLTPISNPPSCASLSPFLSPSQPPSSHRIRGLNSPSRSANKRNANHYTGKPSPLCHYSPNHPRASKRDISYHEDSHESDDSDATVVYPKRSKKYISYKKSNVGSVNKTSLENTTEYASRPTYSGYKARKGVKQEEDYSNFESELERCKHELASLVSDIRENVAKHKAMRRSRRTNSFSGEKNLPLSQNQEQVDNLSNSRPGLERFISVEPVMDSDSPYKSMSRDAGHDNLNFDGEQNDQNLLDFVTMLNLQTETSNPQNERGSDSEAETKLYDMNFSHLKKEKDAAKTRKCIHKTGNIFENDNKSSGSSSGLLSPGSRLTIDEDGYIASTDPREEHPDVVIENAESDHVILGKEAMDKMKSGIFQSSERFSKKRRKRSRLHFPLADSPHYDTSNRTDDAVSESSSTSSKTGKYRRKKCQSLVSSVDKDGSAKLKGNNSSDDETDSQRAKSMLSPGSTGSGIIDSMSEVKGMQSAAIRSRSLSPGIVLGPKPKSKRGRKPKHVADPIAEHISQSSTARILQELPRFNWLEQKILQQSSNSYKQTSSTTNNNNSNSNNNTSSSTSRAGSTSSPLSSRSSPHVSTNNNKTTTSSLSSSGQPSWSSTTSVNSRRKEPSSSSSSSLSSKGGEKNQRSGKFNVPSNTNSPASDHRQERSKSNASSDIGYLEMASVATQPALTLPDDLARKSPIAAASSETGSASGNDLDLRRSVAPPIKNSNSSSDHNTKSTSPCLNTSTISTTAPISTTTTINGDSGKDETISNTSSVSGSKMTSRVTDDLNSTDMSSENELDLNIPSPDNLAIDFGPPSPEHEKDKNSESGKTEETSSEIVTPKIPPEHGAVRNEDGGNAEEDNVIIVFNLKDASQSANSENEDSPKKPNEKQTSIESNTSSSSVSDFTDSEKTESRHSPSKLVEHPTPNNTSDNKEPVLVQTVTNKDNDSTKDIAKSPKGSSSSVGDTDSVTKNDANVNSENRTGGDIASGENIDTITSTATSISSSSGDNNSPSATTTTTSSSSSSPSLTSTSSLTPSTSASTTTASLNTSSTPAPSLVSVSKSPAIDASSGAPLDLCLKKSDNSVNSIATAGRVKANLPVQMVLPQPQTQTGTSTAVTTVTSHTPMDVTYTTWSSMDQGKSNDDQTDPEKLTGPTNNALVPGLAKDLKEDGSCYMQLKSLDLSSKISISSFSSSECTSPLNLSEIAGFSQDSAQDLTVRVGLTPAPKLNNHSDIPVKRSPSDGETQVLTNKTPQNGTPNDANDVASSAAAKGGKKMTDAELEKEFQKHLIEFRALEKLAERKAQEQIQIGILRKRKAETLRYYDAKRKKRASERVNSSTTVSSPQDKRSTLKSQYSPSQTTVSSPPNSSQMLNGSRSPNEPAPNSPLVLTSGPKDSNEYSNLSKSSRSPDTVPSEEKSNPSSFANQPSSPLALTVSSKTTQNSQSNTAVSLASLPIKAHQNQRSEMPPFTTPASSTTPEMSTSISGPYAKRNTILTEPFGHRRNSTQKENSFQKAHSQRPFQSPGNLIISDIKSKADAVYNASPDSHISSPSMPYSLSVSTQPAPGKQSSPHSPEITTPSPSTKHPPSDPAFPNQLHPQPETYRSQYSPNDPQRYHNAPENYTLNGSDPSMSRPRPPSVPTKNREAVGADMTRHHPELIDPHQAYNPHANKAQPQIPATVSSPKELKRPAPEPRSPPEGPKRYVRKTLNRGGSKEHPIDPVPLMMHPGVVPPPVNMPPPAHSSTEAPRDDHGKHHYRNNHMGKMPRPPPEYATAVSAPEQWPRAPVPFHPSLHMDKNMMHHKDVNSEGPVAMSQEEMQSKYREGPPKPMRQYPQPEALAMPPNSSSSKSVPNPHSPNYYWSQPSSTRPTGVYMPTPQHREGQSHLPPPPSSSSTPLSSSSTASSSSSSTTQPPPIPSSHSGSYPPIHSKRQQQMYQQQQMQNHQKQQQQYLMHLQHHHQQHQQQQQHQHAPDQMLQVPHSAPNGYNGQSRSPDERQPVPMNPMPYPPHGQKMRHPQPHPAASGAPPPPPHHPQAPPPQHGAPAPPLHPHASHPHPHPQQRHPKQQPPPAAPPHSQQSGTSGHHPSHSSSSNSYQSGMPVPLHQGIPQSSQQGPIPPPLSGDTPSAPLYMGPPGSGPPMPSGPLIRVMAPPKWVAMDGSMRQHPSQPPPGPHGLQPRAAHPQSPTQQHLSPQAQGPPQPPQQQQPPPSHTQPRMSRHDEAVPQQMPPQRGGPLAPTALHPSMLSASQASQAHAYNPRDPHGGTVNPNTAASAAAASSSGGNNSLCQLCGKMAAFLCSNCRRVWYCNEQCQSKHWSVHAEKCKPTPADPHYN